MKIEWYNVPDGTDPKLTELIINTESMDKEEVQYWFDILPIMTQEQTERLYNILETEKIKLEELDEKYKKIMTSLS